MTQRLSKLRAFASRLRSDTSGLALTEFAFAMPILLSMGMLGIEVSNLALTHMKVSQAALNLADNISRVGEDSALSLQKLYESDVNDSFHAARLQGTGIGLLTNGRVILSSLQRNASGGQWIKWQRCVGQKAWSSHYGVVNDGVTGTSFAGMGKPTKEIQAPPNGAVMFVEISYNYHPLVGNFFMQDQVINSTAAYIVRDNRDLTQLYQHTPADPVASCNIYGT
jgi:hypothetical protein